MLLNPWLWSLILLLTVFGVVFSFIKYEVGKEGWGAIIAKHPDWDRDKFHRVTDLFDRHGSIVLLGSAIPGLDSVVTLTAGAVGVRKGTFVFWVTVAKFTRFTLLAFLLTWIIGLVRQWPLFGEIGLVEILEARPENSLVIDYLIAVPVPIAHLRSRLQEIASGNQSPVI